MKIAVASNKPGLDGEVEQRLGTAAHLLVVETTDMSFEALDGPPPSSGPGAGVAALSLVAGLGVQAVLVGHVAPHIVAAMQKRGIEVVTGVTGPVAKALADYLESRAAGEEPERAAHESGGQVKGTMPGSWAEALKKGLRQFYSFLPKLVGVVLLLGLFRGFVSEQALRALFSGSELSDSLIGAGLGGILAGNPVNSYVIGKSLLSTGVGLAGVTALMLAWVNVGLIQLPAEVAAMGTRFALVRNLAGFVLAVAIALLMTLLQGGTV